MTSFPSHSYSLGAGAGALQSPLHQAQASLPMTPLIRLSTPERVPDDAIDADYGDVVEIEDAETTALKDKLHAAEHQLIHVKRLFDAAIAKILNLQRERDQLKEQLKDKDSQLDISAELFGEVVMTILKDKDDGKSPGSLPVNLKES